MKKEVSIAIVIGILLGAIILYGINLANTSTKNLPKLISNPNSIPSNNQSTPSSSPSATLNITSHTSHQVVFDKEITLTGKSDPQNTVAVIWEDNEDFVESDDKGNFSQKITLIPGENNIQISMVNPKGTLETIILKLYFSLKPLE